MKLTAGTRIYFGGDMANGSSFGTIKKAYANEWGSFVDIDLDDKRFETDSKEIKRLPICAFSEVYLGHGGTRFVTEEAYNTWKGKSS